MKHSKHLVPTLFNLHKSMGVVTRLSLIIISALQVRKLQLGELPVTQLMSGRISGWSLGANILHDTCVHLT